MQMQLDTTIPLSPSKNSSRPVSEPHSASLKNKGSFAEVLENTTKQSYKKEPQNGSDEHEPLDPIDKTSQIPPRKSQHNSKAGDVQDETTLSSGDAAIKSSDGLELEEVNNKKPNTEENDDVKIPVLTENDGNSLPKDVAKTVFFAGKDPVNENESYSDALPVESVALVENSSTAEESIGEEHSLSGDVVIDGELGDEAIIVLNYEAAVLSESESEKTAIDNGALQSDFVKNVEDTHTVNISLSNNSSEDVDDSFNSIEDDDFVNLGIDSSTPSEVTLKEKLEALSLSLSSNVLGSDEGTDFIKELPQVENINSISSPIVDLEVEVDSVSQENNLNLAWVFGEMKKQAPLESKENIGLGVGDKVDSSPVISQQTSFTKLSPNINNAMGLGESVEIDLSLLSDKVPLDVNTKGGNKGALQALSELILPVDLPLDESLSIEPSELLKNSKLFDTHMEGLASMDSKVVTPLVTALGSPVLAVTPQGVQVTSQPVLTMSVPPTDPTWAQEMGEKVKWVMREGVQTAEIHLDPPELGSLSVKVSLDGDVASVSFSAATPQARDLLESQLQRLREQLAQQGVDLTKVDVNVSQQKQEQGSEPNSGRSDHNGSLGGDEDSFIEENTSYVNASGVDYYA